MDVIDEVKSRLAIEDVIGEYVRLKRAGRNYKGLSPFTNEKSPSFIVSPEKQIWKDFSSGKGGSVFDFVMIVEGLDFKEALDFLANKAGIDPEEYKSKRKSNINKDRLYEILELSAKYYQACLLRHKTATNYVYNERKFNKSTVASFKIGYSPSSGNALLKFLLSRSFALNEIKIAGLISEYRNEQRDMFRNRIMFPLSDAQGRVIGFTARTLDNNPNVPKYINSPQTILYDKSRQIYGLHLAKEAIRIDNYSVLVEGNLDVITSFQAGVKQTVATAGTALTIYQLNTLGRFSSDIRLAFDSDKAGLNATERALPLAQTAKVNLSIINLPEGKDPDELIKKDKELWLKAINKPIYAMDWIIDRYLNIYDVTLAIGKKDLTDKLMPLIRNLSDPVEKDHYINVLSKKLSVSTDSLNDKFKSENIENKLRKVRPIEKEESLSDRINAQDKFLSLVLIRPTLREFLNKQLSSIMLPSEVAVDLFEYLKNNPSVKVEEIKVHNLEDYVKIETLLYEELYQGIELDELYGEANRLLAVLVTKYIKTEKSKLSNKLKSISDETELRSLQEHDKKLNLLLNQIQGEVHA